MAVEKFLFLQLCTKYLLKIFPDIFYYNYFRFKAMRSLIQAISLRAEQSTLTEVRINYSGGKIVLLSRICQQEETTMFTVEPARNLMSLRVRQEYGFVIWPF